MTPSDSAQAPPSTPLVASVRIAAPPDVVFGYFTEPSLITKWLAETATLDARPGGTGRRAHPEPGRQNENLLQFWVERP